MRYRSKPTEIEAVQWNGDPNDLRGFQAPIMFDYTDSEEGVLRLHAGVRGAQGWVDVPVGHWIVRNPGDLTDFWPVDPEVFARKYEPVEESTA